jgi:hypothetical protein
MASAQACEVSTSWGGVSEDHSLRLHRYDGIVASTISKLLPLLLLKYSNTQCVANMRIGIPTSSQTPCVEELRLLTANSIIANGTLKKAL